MYIEIVKKSKESMKINVDQKLGGQEGSRSYKAKTKRCGTHDIKAPYASETSGKQKEREQ